MINNRISYLFLAVLCFMGTIGAVDGAINEAAQRKQLKRPLSALTEDVPQSTLDKQFVDQIEKVVESRGFEEVYTQQPYDSNSKTFKRSITIIFKEPVHVAGKTITQIEISMEKPYNVTIMTPDGRLVDTILSQESRRELHGIIIAAYERSQIKGPEQLLISHYRLDEIFIDLIKKVIHDESFLAVALQNRYNSSEKQSKQVFAIIFHEPLVFAGLKFSHIDVETIMPHAVTARNSNMVFFNLIMSEPAALELYNILRDAYNRFPLKGMSENTTYHGPKIEKPR